MRKILPVVCLVCARRWPDEGFVTIGDIPGYGAVFLCGRCVDAMKDTFDRAQRSPRGDDAFRV